MKSVGGQLHASPFLAGSSQPMLIQTLARVHAAACVYAGRPVACQCQRKTGCWALAQTSASETLCSPCKPSGKAALPNLVRGSGYTGEPDQHAGQLLCPRGYFLASHASCQTIEP